MSVAASLQKFDSPFPKKITVRRTVAVVRKTDLSESPGDLKMKNPNSKPAATSDDAEFDRSKLMQKAKNLKKKKKKKKVRNGGSDVAEELNGQWSFEKEQIEKFEKAENARSFEIDEAESRLVEIVKSTSGYGSELSYELVVRGLGLVEECKRVEMVEKWEILLRDESELNLRRLELVQEQGKLALDAFKVSSH